MVRLADLPLETRAALAAAEVAPDNVDALQRFAVATPRQRAEAERRLAALD